MTAKRILSSFKQSWIWLKWPIAAALLFVLAYQHRSDFSRLVDQRFEWIALTVAFSLCLGAVVFTFLRWYLLVWALDFPFRLRDALRLGFIGYLFNYLGPGAAGGDLIKGVMIAREQSSRRMMAAATVVLDRILGLLALFVVGALASLSQRPLWDVPEISVIVAVLWTGSLVGLVGLAVMLHPAVPRSRWLRRLVELPYVGRIIADLVNGVLLYQSKPRVIALALLISLVGHLMMLSSFYYCAQALQLGPAAPSFGAQLMLIPGAELAGVVIPLPGGTGALEGAVKYVYGLAQRAGGSPIGEQTAQAAGLLAALVYRAISLSIAAIGAV